MEPTIWFVIFGALFIAMALTGGIVERLPLSASLIYLVVGIVLGPLGFGLLRFDPLAETSLLEILSEIAVILSLFATGLKLRLSWRDRAWRIPVRLAFVAMVLTVLFIAAAGYAWLGLPLGAAVLLGAILAPTDPVLASEVSVREPGDQDRLRFALTGEAGLNDGTAFPFVYLGLGLLGLHELGTNGWRWVTIDVIWAIGGGLGIGALLGSLVARWVLHLRQRHQEAVGMDEFVVLGLIGLTYGLALLLHTYGFLAVFAAGLAMRRIERQAHGDEAPPEVSLAMADSASAELATQEKSAPAYMAQATLVFNQQIERLSTVLLMIIVGSLLNPATIPPAAFWFAPLLFFVLRPAAVVIGLAGAKITAMQRGLIAWFGIRGLGSVYYLTFAITHGVPTPIAETLAGLVLAVITGSVILHGISVTPLLNRYEEAR